MSTPFLTPSPGNGSGGVSDAPARNIPLLPPPYSEAAYSSAPGPPSSTSVVVVVIVVASAVVVSALVLILLRLLSKRFNGSFRAFSAADDVVPRYGSFRGDSGGQQEYDVATASLLDSLPLFTFGSVSGNLSAGDCAVCLSKFEVDDQLRLLPLCCHAFHAGCIDAWIVSNQSCPLCRSSVIASESDLLGKILSADNRGAVGSTRNPHSGSFRVEIGSISRRHGIPVEAGAAAAGDGGRRAYSIGSFDYIVDDSGYEVSVASTNHRRGPSDSTSADKESSLGIPIPDPPAESLAAEVSTTRNWLRDYFDRLPSISRSSRALSFRGSGRFFSNSSRRIEAEDPDPSRVGQEISELFRWLTGI